METLLKRSDVLIKVGIKSMTFNLSAKILHDRKESLLIDISKNLSKCNCVTNFYDDAIYLIESIEGLEYVDISDEYILKRMLQNNLKIHRVSIRNKELVIGNFIIDKGKTKHDYSLKIYLVKI